MVGKRVTNVLGVFHVITTVFLIFSLLKLVLVDPRTCLPQTDVQEYSVKN